MIVLAPRERDRDIEAQFSSWFSCIDVRVVTHSCVWQVHLAHFGGLIWPTLSY